MTLRTGTGYGFHASNPGGEGILTDDEYKSDVCGIVYMCASAEFNGIPHGDNPNGVAVFLAEERYGAFLPGLFEGEDLSGNCRAGRDSLVYGGLYFGELDPTNDAAQIASLETDNASLGLELDLHRENLNVLRAIHLELGTLDF